MKKASGQSLRRMIERAGVRVGVALATLLICATTAALGQTADSGTPASPPLLDDAAATTYCRTLVVVQGTTAPLIFRDSFLDELGRVASPVHLKIRIDDCDPYFYYLNAEDIQKVGTFVDWYHHTRVAVKREDVVTVPVASLVEPAKPVAKPPARKANKSAAKSVVKPAPKAR